MTWAGYWWPLLVQWVLGATVTTVVAGLVRRTYRRDRDRIEPLLEAVEGLLAGPRGESSPGVAVAVVRSRRRKGRRMRVDQFHKAIAAGAGVTLILLLEWATTGTNLRDVLQPVVPAQLLPLVGPVVGGMATVVAVVRAPRNADGPTIEAPAPPVPDTDSGSDGLSERPVGTVPAAAAAATPPVAATTAAAAVGPFWAGVPGGAPTTSTSIVRLQPLPESSPL